MAEVWRARHLHLDKEVAIKVMARNLVGDPKFEERFLQEARAMARLQHPNIVGATDFFIEESAYCLVMPYLDGGSLGDVLDRLRGPLPLEQALSIARQILSALDHAHQKGIIHRDVKPSNILLDTEERAYLADFGIALMMGEDRKTKTGTAIGTPHYMSPEQIMRPKTMDHRSDVYSFGCVLFEMLTGKPPYNADDQEGDTDFVVKNAHITTPVPDPGELNPSVPPNIRQAIMKAMAKDPEERFSGCGEFAASLGRENTTVIVTRSEGNPGSSVQNGNIPYPSASLATDLLTISSRKSQPAPSGTYDRHGNTEAMTAQTATAPLLPAPRTPQGTPPSGPEFGLPQRQGPWPMVGGVKFILVGVGLAAVLGFLGYNSWSGSQAMTKRTPELAMPQRENAEFTARPADINRQEQRIPAKETEAEKATSIESEVMQRFQNWIRDSQNPQADLSEYYAESLRFYLQKQYSKAQVISEKAMFFRKYERVELQITNATVHVAAPNIREIIYDKSFSLIALDPLKSRTGSTIGHVTFTQYGDIWKITSEWDQKK